MKKSILILFSVIVLLLGANVANSKVITANPATASAIKLYKAGDYTNAYSSLKEIVKKENANALTYYYLAMTEVQLGKIDEAIRDYETVMKMSPNGVLGSYAKKGKKCVETPNKCHEPEISPFAAKDTDEDRFIKGGYGSGFSKEARGVHEQQKINNLRREINRREELTPQNFKDYKDFSSQGPSNDEIVSALRTLQRAGLSDVIGNSNYNSDVANLLGVENNSNKAGYDVLNMLFSQKNNSTTTTNLNPQVIQSLLTSQMMTGF